MKSLLIVLLCAAAGLTTSAVLRTDADQTALRSRTSELSPVTQETDQSRVVHRTRRDHAIDDPFRVYYNPCWFGIDEETNKEIMRCADGTTERKFRERANSGW